VKEADEFRRLTRNISSLLLVGTDEDAARSNLCRASEYSRGESTANQRTNVGGLWKGHAGDITQGRHLMRPL
jgi:hypothetical protein